MATGDLIAKYGASTAFTITLASLASSTSGVGRQTSMVDNSTTRFRAVRVYGKFTLGTTPTGNKGVYLYALFGDANGTPHRTDGAGASDAALTVLNAPLLKVGRDKASPSTGDIVYVEGIITDPGPEFGVCVVHDTAVNLSSNGAFSWLRYIGIYDAVL